jgi:hypothetical protein
VEYMTYYLTADTGGYAHDQPYMIRLVSGKVESFGRFAQLFDLDNRPVTNAQPGQPDFPQAGYNPALPMMGPPLPAGSSAPADLATEISRLKALKDQGVLTDEEFQKAKAKLLSQP